MIKKIYFTAILFPIAVFAFLCALAGCSGKKAVAPAPDDTGTQAEETLTEDAEQEDADKDYSELEHPYVLTAIPFQDDRDGCYWMFFEAGHGARFTGFDGEWLVGEQLFTWGVDEGILYIFPVNGETEQYPITFSSSIEDDSVDLGEIKLNEVYPKELEALYNQWVPIGRQIKEKLNLGN